MAGFLKARNSLSHFRRGARLQGLGVFVALCSALSPSFLLAEGGVFVQQSAAVSEVPVSSSVACSVVATDVALYAEGVLRGVVLSRSPVSDTVAAVGGKRIVLLRDGKVVAETRSDQAGRFVVSHLRGGKYVIATADQDGVEWSLHRLWVPGTAPPKANAVARVVLGEGVVRGQGPLPAVSFSEAALMAGVVAGAVAAPVIYHNAQKSNRVPASP